VAGHRDEELQDIAAEMPEEIAKRGQLREVCRKARARPADVVWSALQ
jgi:hypothetical protein